MKEHTVKLNVDAKDGIKQVDELKKGVQETNTAASNSKSSFQKMKTGVGAVGVAFKALGIGLIVGAFVKLKDMLGQNQVVMDKLSVASEALGFIFQRIVDVSVKFGQKVTEAFSNPKQAIEDLWTSLKQNIVNRVEGLIDLFGSLGTVIEGVFKRDLDLIKEGASDAGTAIIQLSTGLDEVQQNKAAETMTKIWTETKKATTEATAYGKAITKMKNEVKLAEANQRQLQLTYQKDAELQRQIRDDVSLTFEERIAANEKLGQILDEQFEEEKALAQKKIDLAQMELNQNKDNVDLQVALINAKTEMADLDERITGQRSEQLVNLTGLQKEKTDAEQAELDLWLKKEAARNKDLADQKIAADKALKIAKEKAKADAEIERKLAETKRNIVANALGQVASLMGEESKAGKALAVGQALINTYSAAAAALAPPPIGAGPILGPIAAIGAVAAGMMNVKQILATKIPGAEGGGGSSGPEPAVPQEVVGGIGGMIPNLENISPAGGDGAQPVQAFVVENDISNAQALQSELDLQATL